MSFGWRLILGVCAIGTLVGCHQGPVVQVQGGGNTPPPRDAATHDTSLGGDVDGSADGAITPSWDPSLPGPHEVMTKSLRLSIPGVSIDDTSAETYFPQDVSEAPLIVFNGAYSAPHSAYASLANHLASHGFIVAFPNDLCVPTSCIQTLAAYISRLVAASLAGEDGSRSEALRYLGIRVSGAGFMGHGIGGKIAILASVAREDEVGTWAPVLSLNPLNLRAPSGEYTPTYYPNALGVVHRLPLYGVFGSTHEGECLGNDLLPSSTDFIFGDGQTVYEWLSAEAQWADFLSEPGACGDHCEVCGWASDAHTEAQAASRAFSTAFFALTLQDNSEAEALLYGPAAWGDVTHNKYEAPAP